MGTRKPFSTSTLVVTKAPKSVAVGVGRNGSGRHVYVPAGAVGGEHHEACCDESRENRHVETCLCEFGLYVLGVVLLLLLLSVLKGAHF